MSPRNYYVVLGVAPADTDRRIRDAYRELVKRHHPDQVGPDGAARFREIHEAYAVLGDHRRRREYDARVARTLERVFVRDLSLRHDLVDARPSADELFAHICRNFTRGNVPGGEGPFELEVDVAISGEEAVAGTRLRLAVPVFVPCTRCSGRGCFLCHGRGTSESSRVLDFHVPPMSPTNATFVVPLTDIDVHGFFLTIRVRVDRTLPPPAA